MNSEKVKEIKKALQDHSIEKLKYQDGIKIKEIDFADILTLINELEKENSKLLDSVETVQSNRCVYKCVLTKEHLTKFAERLKEKYGKSCSEYYPLLLELTSEQLDETLKEFLDDRPLP